MRPDEARDHWQRSDLAQGLLALACWLTHAAAHARRGSTPELLWGCNVGALFIACGLLARERSLASIGTLWLCAGTPLWLMDLAGGGEWLWTSLLTHGVVFSIGLRATVVHGPVEGAWWRALLGGALLQQCTRWLTHWSININVAWGIYPPMRRHFAGFERYWAFTFVSLAVAYACLHGLFAALHARRAGRAGGAASGGSGTLAA